MVISENQHAQAIAKFKTHKQELDLTSGGLWQTAVKTRTLSVQLLIRSMTLGAIGGSWILAGGQITAQRPAILIERQAFLGSIVGALLGGVWTGCKFFLIQAPVQPETRSINSEEAQRAKDFFKKAINELSNNLEEGSGLEDPIEKELFCMPVKACQIGKVSHIFEYNQIVGLATCPICRRKISLETIQIAIETRKKVSEAIGEKISEKLAQENKGLQHMVQKTLELRNQRIDEIFGEANDLMVQLGRSLKITTLKIQASGK